MTGRWAGYHSDPLGGAVRARWLLREKVASVLRSAVHPSERVLRQMLQHGEAHDTFVIYGRPSDAHMASVFPPVDDGLVTCAVSVMSPGPVTGPIARCRR